MPKRVKPEMPQPHADSPTLEDAKPTAPVAVPRVTLAEAEKAGFTLTEAEHRTLKKAWRCAADGQMNIGARCTTCGASK